MLFQLTAYRRTGKDYLFTNLPNVRTLGWVVYGPCGSNLKLPTKAVRMAFADKLKVMVCEHLGLDKIENPSKIHPILNVNHSMTSSEWLTSGSIDLLKDIPCNEVNLPYLNVKTLRHWLIEYGWEKKQNGNLRYFVDLIEKEVQDEIKRGNSVFITDTRYPYEVIDQSVTIRLFRSDVPIPPADDHSERSMDNYRCDYVLCLNNDEFEILKMAQPQYSEYVYCGILD